MSGLVGQWLAPFSLGAKRMTQYIAMFTDQFYTTVAVQADSEEEARKGAIEYATERWNHLDWCNVNGDRSDKLLSIVEARKPNMTKRPKAKDVGPLLSLPVNHDFEA
jgi:hypothetical protein